MSAEKADLARAGTMQVTAKEGKAYLDKNLTEWKKPYLMDDNENAEKTEENAADDVEEEVETDSSPLKKPKMSKHTTMKGTAKEAAGFLDTHGKPDQDAMTRGQQKKIEKIQAEKASPKKGRMARDNTMASTAKEGRALVGDGLGDTRAETKKKGPSKAKAARSTTIDKVTAEAKLLYGDLPNSEGRSLRKRSAPPPAKAPLKKKGTMQRTAKEGKEYLKRGRPSKKNAEKAKEEDKEEEHPAEEEEHEADEK